MNISEVAKLVGLSSKQIRDYEKSGLLKPAQRSLSFGQCAARAE